MALLETNFLFRKNKNKFRSKNENKIKNREK